jgi:hypothetical protein
MTVRERPGRSGMRLPRDSQLETHYWEAYMQKVIVAVAILAMAATSASALALKPGVSIGQYYNFENLYDGDDLTDVGSGWYLDASNGYAIERSDSVAFTAAAGDIYLGDNWGVLRLNSLGVLGDPTYYNDNNGAAPRQELTGIFYGLDVISSTAVGGGIFIVDSTGGRLDFYNETTTTAATRFLTGSGVRNFEYNTASIGVSGGLPTYTSATEGTRVASLLFDDGISGAGVTISGTFLAGVPSNGSASGYLSVIADGAPWANMLDTNYFATPFGGRDAINQNSFFASDAGAVAVGGLHGWTLFSSDPIQIAPTPEPGTFALLGLGMLGLGYCVRRRRRS